MPTSALTAGNTNSLHIAFIRSCWLRADVGIGPYVPFFGTHRIFTASLTVVGRRSENNKAKENL